MIRVFYSDNALFIDGIRQAMVAASLVASAVGNQISIQPINAAPPIAADDFSVFARQDGTGFASVAETMAYLATQFSMRRPLGFVFTQNEPVTSWAIGHDLGFFPTVTVLDTTGEQIIGGLAYPDINTVILSFGYPSSGTAYLS